MCKLRQLIDSQSFVHNVLSSIDPKEKRIQDDGTEVEVMVDPLKDLKGKERKKSTEYELC